MSDLLWSATVGDEGLEVALSRTDKGQFQITITRDDYPTKVCRTATEVRILGEALRLAGMAAMESVKEDA